MEMNAVVAANIREARRARGWSQQQLAEQMTEAGVAWTRPIVGYAENAGRKLTVDELVALAVVFGTTPGFWLAPPASSFDNDSPVVTTGKTELSGSWLVAAAAAGDAAPSPIGDDGPSAWARLFDVMGRVVAREGMSSPNARLLHQTLARLRAAVAGDE
jgi:transcriptional regulator with XRE-family HTH domain